MTCDKSRFALNLLIPLLMGLLFAAPVRGQNPFGDSGDSNQAAPQVNPFGQSAGTGVAESDAQPKQDERDPRVLAVQAWNPTSADQQLVAVEVLINYGRADAAKPYVQQVLDANLSQGELAKLASKFGSPFFVRLSRLEALSPLGMELSKQALEAARAEASGSPKVQALVSQLLQAAKTNDRVLKLTTLTDLKIAGPSSVPTLLAALVDREAAANAAIEDGLVELGRPAVPAMAAALQAESALIRTHVHRALGRIGDSIGLPYQLRDAWVGADSSVQEAARASLVRLVGRLPEQAEAIRFLNYEIDRQLQGLSSRPLNGKDPLDVWTWDATENRLATQRQLPDDLTRINAARLAADLYQLQPESREARDQMLISGLESAKRLGGFERPLDGSQPIAGELGKLSTAELESLLVQADKRGQQGAVIAVMERIAAQADISVLVSPDGRATPLARMLTHPDARIRMSAAKAIMQIGPTQAFPGSSQLVPVFVGALSSGKSLQMLVVDPQIERARSVAALFEQAGFDSVIVPASKDAMRLVVGNQQFQFALFAASLHHPSADHLLQWARQDYRISGTPIGILYSSLNESLAKRMASEDELTESFPRPAELTDVARDLKVIRELAGRSWLDLEERRRQAAFALQSLEALSADPAQFAHLELVRAEVELMKALFDKEYSQLSSQILARIGTAEAQSALVDYASQSSLPLPLREAATRAFEESVAKYRILLTQAEILEQYNRYNASESLDQATQQVLGRILDAIEQPQTEAALQGR